MELWRLAKASGTTPWQALRDPHLAFNLEVMRANDIARRTQMKLRVGQGADPLSAMLEGICEAL